MAPPSPQGYAVCALLFSRLTANQGHTSATVVPQTSGALEQDSGFIPESELLLSLVSQAATLVGCSVKGLMEEEGMRRQSIKEAAGEKGRDSNLSFLQELFI